MVNYKLLMYFVELPTEAQKKLFYLKIEWFNWINMKNVIYTKNGIPPKNLSLFSKINIFRQQSIIPPYWKLESNKKAPEKQRLLKRVRKSDYALADTLILIRPEKPLPSFTTT